MAKEIKYGAEARAALEAGLAKGGEFIVYSLLIPCLEGRGITVLPM